MALSESAGRVQGDPRCLIAETAQVPPLPSGPIRLDRPRDDRIRIPHPNAMADSEKKRLKKELALLDVYAVATGATLSSGFFLLPGLAAAQVGPGIVAAYLLAAVPLIPAMFSIAELATAMPRAGGVYYFLDRTLGPVAGTIGGLGTWLALVLKVAFALVGMGAYISLYLPELPIVPVAVLLAVALGMLNLSGARKTGGFQMFLVALLLVILIGFIASGLPAIQTAHFSARSQVGHASLLATAGLVYISYVGVTNVASLSEEVRNPERNIPLGIFLAIGTAIAIYGLGTAVMVGVLAQDRLSGDLTPVASAAEVFLGPPGKAVVTLAALLAFISVANAGTLSASRYPLAMSRDHILPGFFGRLTSGTSPVYSTAATVALIVAVIALMDPVRIAKLASAFQLLMFALVCLAVIVMRESRLASYDPGYRSRFYPWMQIFGILASIWLIIEMGTLLQLFSGGLVVLGLFWYLYYVRDKVNRTGAIYHIFERLGHRRYVGLDYELRGIMKEKGLREEDPFDEVVARSLVIDLKGTAEFEAVVHQVAEWLAQHVPHEAEEVENQILERTHIGATPVAHGVGLPHLRIDGIQHAEMVLVRSRPGIHIIYTDPLTHAQRAEQTLTALFFLFSPETNPTQHLRILAQIAGRVEEASFEKDWNAANDEQELKEALLRDERFLSFYVRKDGKTGPMIGRALRDLDLPQSCLVALLRRGGQMVAPSGRTVFREGDRITVIGDSAGLQEIRDRFLGV